jgi:Ca2+-binding EF-hand superfamily protein
LPPQGSQSGFYDEGTAIDSLSKVKERKNNPEMRVLFKEFDKDKDGYVSRDEFKDKIHNLSVLENWEVENLTNYFDPEGKGYMNFKDFACKFTKGDK